MEALRDAALAKIEAAKNQTLLSLVQLNCQSMQQMGEHHVMLKAKYEGLEEAALLIEAAYRELMGKPAEADNEKEEGIY